MQLESVCVSVIGRSGRLHPPSQLCPKGQQLPRKKHIEQHRDMYHTPKQREVRRKSEKKKKKIPTLNGDVVATGGSNSRTGVADVFRDFVFGCPDLSHSCSDCHVDVFNSGGSFGVGDEVDVGELVEEVEVSGVDLVVAHLGDRHLESKEIVGKWRFRDVSPVVGWIPS